MALKRITIFLSLLSVIAACGTSKKASSSDPDKGLTLKTELLKPGYIQRIVATNHVKLLHTKGDYNSFKTYVKGLDSARPESIAFAMDYFKTCIPLSDSISADSSFLCFRDKLNKVLFSITDSVVKWYAGVADSSVGADTSASPRVITFINNLKACGLGVFSTEGEAYLDVLPDYYYQSFKNWVTLDLKQFLWLQQNDLEQGFVEDGGLVISFDTLYHRIDNWDKYFVAYPKSICNGEAKELYYSYLKILLTGEDNTPVFNADTHVLLPELKKLFAKISKQKPVTKTSKIISDYYTMLSKNGFKGTDAIVKKFMKGHGLDNTDEQPLLK